MNHAEDTASIVKEVCLLIHCLAEDVLLLSTFASTGMCLASHYLATSRYVLNWYFVVLALLFTVLERDINLSVI
jgi:hypothetical protein